MIGRYLCKCPKLYPYDVADLWPEAPPVRSQPCTAYPEISAPTLARSMDCDALESLRVLSHHIALSKERRGRGEHDEAAFRSQSINHNSEVDGSTGCISSRHDF